MQLSVWRGRIPITLVVLYGIFVAIISGIITALQPVVGITGSLILCLFALFLFTRKQITGALFNVVLLVLCLLPFNGQR